MPVVVELLPLRERLATRAGREAASCRRTPQRRATHAYPARCIFSNGGADPSSSPSSGAAQRHHHQIAGGNPRPSETLDPRASAALASGTPEFASNRPIQADRLAGGARIRRNRRAPVGADWGFGGFRAWVSGAG